MIHIEEPAWCASPTGTPGRAVTAGRVPGVTAGPSAAIAPDRAALA